MWLQCILQAWALMLPGGTQRSPKLASNHTSVLPAPSALLCVGEGTQLEPRGLPDLSVWSQCLTTLSEWPEERREWRTPELCRGFPLEFGRAPVRVCRSPRAREGPNEKQQRGKARAHPGWVRAPCPRDKVETPKCAGHWVQYWAASCFRRAVQLSLD